MQTADDTGAGAHLEAQLPLYHLGVLSAVEGRVVVTHLGECSECRAVQAEVCDLLGTLALLTDDREALVSAFGALGTSRPAALPDRFAPAEPSEPYRLWHSALHRSRRHKEKTGPEFPSASEFATPPVDERPPSVMVRPDPPALHQSAPSSREAEPREPPPRQPPSGGLPSRDPEPFDEIFAMPGRVRRRRSLVAASLMLASVTALGGLAVSALVFGVPGGDERPATTVALTAVASATDRDTGAQLSAFLTEQPGGVAIRATVNRLTKGQGYRLYAQAYSGQRWPVVNWTGADGVQEVHGVVPSTIAELSRLIVERSDHKPVVIAYLPRRPGRELATPGR